jgi:hypothetical protein
MKLARLVSFVAVIALAAVGTLAGQPGRAASRSTPPMTVRTPAAGSDTSARTVVVSGTSPRGRKGPGYVVRRLRVNGRRLRLRARRDGSYSREVVLDVGRNVITAKAQIFRSWRDRDPVVVSSEPVVVTRTPVAGDETGSLDLATSFLVTDRSRALYWLCGESDDCMTRVACFSVTTTRVDCPAGWREWSGGGWGPWKCGLVVSVTLRDERLYSGRYGCSGPWKPDPQRFVQPAVEHEGRRFTVDLEKAPWAREELASANRYGLPRFDGDGDVFIP